ncbi:glycosyl transferase, group 1 [Candidatus Koribacter versatilis Ellin345]|uniref:Glycosyl transferase, group 1 n=1 Tax=Koribacter versatilis (strain Ellin345) TaxID=204669 RepID=Q1ILE4_KORVE|nr:glycosyltransferase family 4 protein [Candidatus Koribacter versatilis]ABF42306.1 glycosyl transferase, group 1 [Candidatus Koribacter versatilis Ellin345]
MKFLILSQYFYPEVGATQTRLAGTAAEIVLAGHEVEVLTGLPNAPAGKIFPDYRGRFYMRDEWNGCPVHRTWLYAATGKSLARVMNYGSFALASWWEARRVKKPDYVFVESPPLTTAWPGLRIAKKLGARLIFNVSDLWPDSVRDLGVMSDGRAFRTLEKMEIGIYRKSFAVTAVTEGIRDRIINVKGIPAEKVLFLPNGADTDTYRPLPPDTELAAKLGLTGKKVVYFAGTLGYAQGLHSVITAAETLQRNQPLVHFLFIGEGPEKPRLKEAVATKGLRNVSFVDAVPAKEISRYASIAMCGLVQLLDIPLFEGARPGKTTAIMSCGRPVIYAVRGEGVRLMERSNAGWVIPPMDPDALVGAILEMVANPDEVQRRGENGRRYIEQHMTWEILVRDWLSQLERLSAATRA